MTRRRSRPSPLSVGVTLVVAAITVLAFVLTQRSVNSQNQDLLKSDTSQAAEYVSSIVSELGSELTVLASGVRQTNGSAAAFEAEARSLAQAGIPFTTGFLAQKTGSGYAVTAAVGAGYSAGERLSPSLNRTLAKADSDLTPGAVHFDGRTTTLGFAMGPPVLPQGYALFEALSISPYLAITASQAAPFHVLEAAVYGSHRPHTNELALANTRDLPLKGATAEAPVDIGNGKWWLVATARSPLAGGFANGAPFIILGVGLLLALAVGTTFEALVRRHRYAAALVAERTAELEASHAALLRSERLSALGEMASTVGHELRNPLAAVINAHFMIRHGLGERIEPDIERNLVMAERQTTRAATLADNLTAFVRQREPNRVPIDLEALLADVLSTTPTPPGVDVQIDVAPLVLDADSDQLTQVLANLIVNGFQAMPDGGTLRITASAGDSEVVLSVADSGTGVDAEAIERAFDPFFTTKASGTGLGLAIVARIVEAHGGQVTLANAPAGGAVVTVHLPVTSSTELARR